MMNANKVKVIVNKDSKPEMRLNLIDKELTIFARDKEDAKKALAEAITSGWIDKERAETQREDLERFLKV